MTRLSRPATVNVANIDCYTTSTAKVIVSDYRYFLTKICDA
jgi:hypothetical protein